MSNKVLVIGAQNIDIFTKTKEDYQLRDSNICDVSLAFGGVGRNIAENLSRLHNEVSFLTVFSMDHFGQAAKDSLIKMDIDVSESISVDGYSNSIYLGILDKENDLYLGLNDMKIIDELSVSFLQSKIKYINSFNYVVIDNNLKKSSIEYLLKNIKGTTIMDAVSAHKIDKLVNQLEYIDYLKVNKIEYHELIKRREQLELVNLPNNLNLIVTDGHKEIEFIGQLRIKTSPITCQNVVNASGAGDGFISGFVHGLLLNVSDELKLEYAKKVAYYTLLSNDATNKDLKNIEVTI